MKCFPEASPECKKQGKRKRIRKSASRLSDNEKLRLRQALESAIANQTNWMNFPDIANFHGAPYKICVDRYNRSQDARESPEGCCPHISQNEKKGTDVMDFLPWHRLVLGIMITNLLFYILNLHMTTLLTHTVAHSTKPSFIPKTNNQPPKKFLSLALS